jgi:hypothetical protein
VSNLGKKDGICNKKFLCKDIIIRRLAAKQFREKCEGKEIYVVCIAKINFYDACQFLNLLRHKKGLPLKIKPAKNIIGI